MYKNLDRVKLETGRRSVPFTRNENDIILKGDFVKLKVSDELSDAYTTFPILALHIKEMHRIPNLIL